MKNKIVKILKNKWIYILFGLLILWSIYFMDLKIKLDDLDLNKSIYYGRFFILSIISIIVTIGLMIFVEKNKKIELWKLYILLGMFMGLLYMFIMPMFSQSDEPSHYYRAYEVSEGFIKSKTIDNQNGNYFPKSIQKSLYLNKDVKREDKNYDDIKKISMFKLNKDEKEFVSGYASNYPAINYFPHAIGMKIASTLNLNPFVIGMFGRFSNLIVCVLLLGLGLKNLPYKKFFMTILLLSPSVLSYLASLSADGFILATSFLLISYILRFMESKEKVTKKQLIILTFLSICVSLCKITYLPIIGIITFIPHKCFKNKTSKWLSCISIIMIGIVCSLIWSKVGNVAATNEVAYRLTYDWIFKHPISYIIIIIRNTMSNSYDFISNIFAGNFLCHSQVKPYAIIPILYFVIFIVSMFNEKSKIKISIVQKIFVIFIALLIYGLICTAMYVYNTACANYNGYPFIIGIQGRYLIPILFLLLFLCNKKIFNVDNSNLINSCLILNLCVLFTMIVTFSI